MENNQWGRFVISGSEFVLNRRRTPEAREATLQKASSAVVIHAIKYFIYPSESSTTIWKHENLKW